MSVFNDITQGMLGVILFLLGFLFTASGVVGLLVDTTFWGIFFLVIGGGILIASRKRIYGN
jgi:uncharacterized membrane protein HdeD (DUF308 family)